MKRIIIKRIYDTPNKQDGYRVLVDKIWPRGISKEDAELDEWLKEIAPSTDLRKWFDHRDDRFEEFSKKYQEELSENHEKGIKELNKKREKHQICLLYGAKNTQSNHAKVLKKYLENI